MSDNNNSIKNVERQLKRLISCIVEKAAQDPEFSSQLAHILNLESPKPKETEKKERVSFNSVELLHTDGLEKLNNELQLKTDAELKDILSQEGVKKQKGQKQLNREDAISTIINHAKRRLAQGASFLRPEIVEIPNS